MKFSTALLENIIGKITAKELDFLICIMRYQNEYGIIKGIDYKTICNEIKIHKSTFYSILHSLEQKRIIWIDWNDYEKPYKLFWTLKILNNSFADAEERKQGYIKLNIPLLYSKDFLKLTKNEKYICLKVLALYRTNRSAIPLRYETIMEWTKSTLQSIKKYVASIKSIFKDIIINKHTILIIFKKDTLKSEKAEVTTYREHIINYITKAYKLNEPKKIIDEVIALFKQYNDVNINIIITAIIKSIKQQGALIPQYINTMINKIKYGEEISLERI
ncbi:hypothetical protein [Clostridium cochlearium]|uniref:hypothetical protein n=1 Tax=Clostridium cochlearium TaxID=1494 RepID=UPI00242002D1|nr:hypothetical protein [Clostridium cochlearium]